MLNISFGSQILSNQITKPVIIITNHLLINTLIMHLIHTGKVFCCHLHSVSTRIYRILLLDTIILFVHCLNLINR